MWIIAGVLLGLVVLAAVVGFHSGPHSHVAASLIGAAAAAWLVFMAVSGRSGSLLWALLSADVVLSAGVGVMAWKGLSSRHAASGQHVPALEAAEGVALSDLVPEGVVRVRGEEWSAVCVNGTARAGSGVQVLRVAGVRLEVWGEEAEAEPPAGLFRLDEAPREEPKP